MYVHVQIYTMAYDHPHHMTTEYVFILKFSCTSRTFLFLALLMTPYLIIHLTIMCPTTTIYSKAQKPSFLIKRSKDG